MTKMVWLFIALFSFSTMVQAAAGDSEELSYDDLVNQLSARKQRPTVVNDSPFDTVQIHAGMGMINSFSTFNVGNSSFTRSETGLEIGLGVDLFSPQWMAEVAWRNFGLTHSGTEEHTLRELDLKFIYRNQLQGPWDYRIQGGLAQRDLQLTDSARDLRVSENTPAALAGIGTIIKMSPNAGLLFDVGGRLPVIQRSADKGSLDVGVEFQLSL